MSKVYIISGRQGAGKTTYSRKLSQQTKGILFSIDAWMWKLYGPDLPSSMNLKWILERVERCELLMWEQSKAILQNGPPVILDWGFTTYAKRKRILNQARDLGFSAQLYFLQAPTHIRKKRILTRNIEQGSTFSFEITKQMFQFMDSEFEDPLSVEIRNSILIDTYNSEFIIS